MDDNDWITIAAAARLTGRSVSTISTLIDQGQLPMRDDPTAPNPRRGRRRVSRAAVLARWPEAAPDGPPQLRLYVTPEEWAIIAPRLVGAPIRDLAQAGLILIDEELRALMATISEDPEELIVERAIRAWVADQHDHAVLRQIWEAEHPGESV